MPRNVEIKARVSDPAQLRALALTLTDTQPQLLRQEDTFYHVPVGRLKLREFGDGTGELIAYVRPDRAEFKASHYAITPAADPATPKASTRTVELSPTPS